MPALKSLITSVLLPVAAIARVKRTYITKADASFDKSLTSRGQVGVVGPNVPAELAELNGYYGPADQIVIPADFSSEHNHAGFLSLVEAVQSGRLVLASEIVIYGPQAPPGALPEKFRYAGFADSLREIYEGKCVVFAPNQNAVGMQNKVWEAVCAGRRVLAGANAAGGLVDSPLVSRYMDGTDLPGALENLVSGASNPDRCENWRENNILRGPKDADMFAFLVEGDSVL
ncbi:MULTISPECIES: hypothetical protein [Nocardiaceae]|uniref:Uncharacterized protein n=1 Tax=Rhodococcoides corynebacterioides TaxID=53972 RepID=A0ABS2KZA0_9NOCA|nr:MULTISPECIES: hypothetical protein [Rhodococcus]MBM7417247.1 hypothetical protein [Rhodococcus corynebacterioides]MBP1115500.1 hypothetical protein [Rhodococcus sp. PvP016]